LDLTIVEVFATGGGGGTGIAAKTSTIGGVLYVALFVGHVGHAACRVIRGKATVRQAVRDEDDAIRKEDHLP
jgi:hypothetical protein